MKVADPCRGVIATQLRLARVEIGERKADVPPYVSGGNPSWPSLSSGCPTSGWSLAIGRSFQKPPDHTSPVPYSKSQVERRSVSRFFSRTVRGHRHDSQIFHKQQAVKATPQRENIKRKRGHSIHRPSKKRTGKAQCRAASRLVLPVSPSLRQKRSRRRHQHSSSKDCHLVRTRLTRTDPGTAVRASASFRRAARPARS